MYDHILLPYDGSEGAAEVQIHAAELAHWAEAAVCVLFVADTTRDSVTVVENSVVDALVEEGQQAVEEAAERLADLGVEYETDVVQGEPASAIAGYATDHDHDLIVMPTQGEQGLAGYLTRSITEDVIAESSVPVLAVRMQPDERLAVPYESVLLPTDGSANARAAADHGLALAAALDAEVHALSVVEDALDAIADDQPVDADQAAAALDEIRSLAADHGVDRLTSEIEHGSPAEGIGDYAESAGVDLVVMGTDGVAGVDERLFGSVAQETARTVPVPVIVVPEPNRVD